MHDVIILLHPCHQNAAVHKHFLNHQLKKNSKEMNVMPNKFEKRKLLTSFCLIKLVI